MFNTAKNKYFYASQLLRLPDIIVKLRSTQIFSKYDQINSQNYEYSEGSLEMRA